MARTLKPRKRKSAAIHVEPKDVQPSTRPALKRARVKVRPIEIQPKTTRDAMAEVVAILLERRP
jgi:hypothetical protein